MPIPYPPGPALTCDQIRDIDTAAIERVGIPGVVLMENAGRHIAEVIYAVLLNPAAERVVILCGAGNNGGDGFVVARQLLNAGVRVDVVLALPADKSKGDAATNLHILEQMGVELIAATDEQGLASARERISAADLIVDALLGTGSTGAPRKQMGTLVELANAAARARRVAVDIPSGLDGDTGEVHEPCFRADATVTMVAPKVGFSQAAAIVGRVVVVDIGTPAALIPGRPKPAAKGLDS